MRYTTIIDIREIPAVWSCKSARDLYVYLCLTSGYHDDDRDIIVDSLRGIAAKSGLSLSAVRHAVQVLTTAKLLRREADIWVVTKWIPTRKISARPSTDAAANEQRAERERQRLKEERKEQRERQNLEAIRAQGKTSFMLYYESQMKKAAEGDAEAAKIVARNKAQYEAHAAAVQHQK